MATDTRAEPFTENDAMDCEYAANVVERMAASSDQPQFDGFNMTVARELRRTAAKIRARIATA